jgi:iron complex outermembrane receptor protein
MKYRILVPTQSKTMKGTLLLGLLLITTVVQAQFELSGSIKDGSTGESLSGVHIMLMGKLTGTITDLNGDYVLKTETLPPFTIQVSMIGFEAQSILIQANMTTLDITLEESVIYAEEIIVAASRVDENILQSSVSVEKIGLLGIKETASDNFYSSLANIKGVDMNVQSLLFRFPNARGFNGGANLRFNQFIDGIDNAPPGLSFAAGNILGLNQLDVESMELIAGASSALYGPGGMNGTLLMTSKNPFEYQGLSAQVQTGVMNIGAPEATPSPMVDANIRYAKAFNDKFAFKLSLGYLQATDWYASDKRNKNNLNDTNLDPYTNPGYDGVNVYGDEVVVPVNLSDFSLQIGEGVAGQQFSPGTPEYDAEVIRVIDLVPDQLVTRTGYAEKDLLNYKTFNARVAASINYRINDDLELSLQGSYANGSSVYTAQSRFSLQNFQAYNGKLEIKSSNFFARVWLLTENAGRTYDAGNTTSQLNETWKPSEQWYTDFVSAFTQGYIYPGGASLPNSYTFARELADNRTKSGNVLQPGNATRPLPGTPEFNNIWDDLKGKPRSDGGGLVVDNSAMYHAEGMYDFSHLFRKLSLQVGASQRVFDLSSDGTIWIDTPGNPIIQYQFGAYAQLARGFFSEQLRVTLSGRFDDNSSFRGNFTPRLSVVYSLDKERMHNVRGSAQSAFRFASTTDQWLNFSLGQLDINGRQFQFNVIGGNREVQDIYGLHDGPVYALSGNNPFTGSPESEPYIIPEFQPETVSALELGYKGLYFQRALYVDAYFYHNTYHGFHASQALVQNPGGATESRFIATISSSTPISTYGWAVGANLNLPKGYMLNGNIANNSLSTQNDYPAGFQTRFNTPSYKINLSFSNFHITDKFGFNIGWHWQNSFLWESDFGVAEIPAYNTLNAQVSMKIPDLSSSIKIGASNLINQYYYTGYGNAQIGGLYYVTLSFDEFMN